MNPSLFEGVRFHPNLVLRFYPNLGFSELGWKIDNLSSFFHKLIKVLSSKNLHNNNYHKRNIYTENN